MSHNFEIFVIPNKAWRLKEGYGWERWGDKCGATGETVVVQLWWYNPNDSRGVDNTVRARGDGHEVISEYIPASWIADLKEGESKELTFSGGTVKVTAKQRNGRYSRFGNFEDVVAMVTA